MHISLSIERFKSTDEHTTNLFEEIFFDFEVTVISYLRHILLKLTGFPFKTKSFKGLSHVHVCTLYNVHVPELLIKIAWQTLTR